MIKSIVFIFFAFLLSSCSSEFSKYEKRGESDVESQRLKGKVQKVVRYWNDELTDVAIYNEYGFYKEKQNYENGKLASTTKYKYDEFGCLIEEVTTFEDERKITYFYEYDANHNRTATKKTLSTPEAPATEKIFISSNKYTYDEFGNKEKVEKRSTESTEKGNFSVYYYDKGGKLIKEHGVSENGYIVNIIQYKYYADGNLYQTIFLNNDETIHDYWEEQNYNKFGSPQKRIHIYPNEPRNYWEQIIEHNSLGDCTMYNNGNAEIEEHSYQYDEHNNWIKKETKRKDKYSTIPDLYTEKREISYF